MGQWLLISSGVLNKSEILNNINTNMQKTGVAIYLNHKVQGAVTTYVTVSDRIISTTLLTKCGPLAIINHHAPDETKPTDTKTAHWDLLTHCAMFKKTPSNCYW